MPVLVSAAGRRNFPDFLSQYIPPLPGTFVNSDSGEALGACPNILAVTLGQRPGIGGAAERTYVAGKDMVSWKEHPVVLRCAALWWQHRRSAKRACVAGKDLVSL